MYVMYEIIFYLRDIIVLYFTQSPSQSAPTILKYQADLIFFRVWNLKKKVQKNRF